MSYVDLLTEAEVTASEQMGVLPRLYHSYPLNLMLLEGSYSQLLERGTGRSERVRLKHALVSMREAGLPVNRTDSGLRIVSRCTRYGNVGYLDIDVQVEDQAEVRAMVQGIMQEQGLPVLVNVHDQVVLMGDLKNHLHGGTGLTRDQLDWECLHTRCHFSYDRLDWMTPQIVSEWVDIFLDFTHLDQLNCWLEDGCSPQDARPWVELHPSLHRRDHVKFFLGQGMSLEQVTEWVAVHPAFADAYTNRHWRLHGLNLDDARRSAHLLRTNKHTQTISHGQVAALSSYKRHHGSLDGYGT